MTKSQLSLFAADNHRFTTKSGWSKRCSTTKVNKADSCLISVFPAIAFMFCMNVSMATVSDDHLEQNREASSYCHVERQTAPAIYKSRGEVVDLPPDSSKNIGASRNSKLVKVKLAWPNKEDTVEFDQYWQKCPTNRWMG